MVTQVQSRTGHIGYRHQLDRARRFLDRLDRPASLDGDGMNDVEFQDMVWAFFQNCWHVKDWVKNDPLVDQVVKDAVIKRAHESVVLRVCRELCNGTKHLGEHPGEASHDHVNTTIVPGGETTMDCLIDNGAGTLVSGRLLARQCIAEWESILQSHGLATTRRS